MSRNISVVKVFSSFGKGVGGHFHDIKHITSGLRSEDVEVKLLNLGRSISPILINESGLISHLYSSKRYLASYLLELRRTLLRLEYDIIHVYDLESYLLVRTALIGKRVSIVLTKCGGPLPAGWYPQDVNLITVSNRDYDFFSGLHENSVGFIPNRINKNLLKLQQEVGVFDFEKPIFLRIVRVTEFYRDSLVAFVEMSLQELFSEYQFVLIGSVENKELYRELLAYIHSTGSNMRIITDEFYTKNASRFVGTAKAIFGTGRGAMEGLVLGKDVYTSDKSSKNATLITGENFNSFLYDNFSERSNSSTLPKCYLNLDDLVTDRLTTQVGSQELLRFYSSTKSLGLSFRDAVNLSRIFLVWKK